MMAAPLAVLFTPVGHFVGFAVENEAVVDFSRAGRFGITYPVVPRPHRFINDCRAACSGLHIGPVTGAAAGGWISERNAAVIACDSGFYQ